MLNSEITIYMNERHMKTQNEEQQEESTRNDLSRKACDLFFDFFLFLLFSAEHFAITVVTIDTMGTMDILIEIKK